MNDYIHKLIFIISMCLIFAISLIFLLKINEPSLDSIDADTPCTRHKVWDKCYLNSIIYSPTNNPYVNIFTKVKFEMTK